MWQADGCSETAIKAFLYNFEKLTSGANLMIPESSLSPVDSLPSYESLSEEKPELLKETVMLKLNGGLGTGMGLEKAKSLLPLKGEDTFLDFIAKQVALTRPLRSLHPASLPPCTPAAPPCPPPPPLPRGPCQVAHMRQSSGVDLAFMLMNSFATSADTLAHLSKYDLAPPRCRWRQLRLTAGRPWRPTKSAAGPPLCFGSSSVPSGDAGPAPRVRAEQGAEGDCGRAGARGVARQARLRVVPARQLGEEGAG